MQFLNKKPLYFIFCVVLAMIFFMGSPTGNGDAASEETYIVRYDSELKDDVETQLLEMGGSITSQLDIIDSFSVEYSGNGVDLFSTIQGVQQVKLDKRVQSAQANKFAQAELELTLSLIHI